MRFNSASAALAALPLAAAHYTFSGLTINGEMVGRDWQYIREHTRGYMPTFQEEAATSNDFRCQPGSSGANVEVYTVKPGDVVGMKQAFGANAIEHPGPTQVYLSKAPGSVKEYNGDGDWIKIAQSLVCKPNPQPADFQKDAWCSWGDNIIDFTVPENLPEGEYLFRGEHIALHGAHDGKAEFYYACAQIKVEGTSGTELQGEKVKIPGVYSVGDAATNFSVWGRSTSYDVIPGPEVAPGGTIRGTADGSSAETVTVEGGSTGGNGGSTGGDEENTGGDEGSNGDDEQTPAPSPVPEPIPETPNTPETPTTPESPNTPKTPNTPPPAQGSQVPDTPIEQPSAPAPGNENGGGECTRKNGRKARRAALRKARRSASKARKALKSRSFRA